MSDRSVVRKEFGEDTACLVEKCAREHGNGINNANKGSDPFKNALLIVIGYDCIAKERFFIYHGFDASKISLFRFERWCKTEGQLDKHDGDCDYLALMAGVYNKFMPESKDE